MRFKKLSTLLFSLVALAAAGSALAQSTGVLEVSIQGLPAGVEAKVTLSSSLLTNPIKIGRSGRISQLRPGSYTLTAERVSVGNAVYTPQFLRQNVEVRANQTTTAQVRHFPPPGSLAITLQGLPENASAQIVLSGEALANPLTINKSSRISDLLPGTYTLSVSEVSVDGLTYSPSFKTQSVVVRSGVESSLVVNFRPPPGSLRVEIVGVPPGQAKVALSNATFSQVLTSSATLDDLEATTYSLAASPVTIGGVIYSVADPQLTVTVSPRQTSVVEVVYRAPPGSLRVNIEGLPNNIPAKVQLRGNGVTLPLESSSVISDLAPGTYTLQAEAVEITGAVYQVSAASQTIEVQTGRLSTALVAYSPPAGNLRFQLEGLSGNATARIAIQGPRGFSRELNLTSSVNLGNLVPGEYTISAFETTINANPYDPTPANQVVQVLPARTLIVNISYALATGRVVVLPRGLPAGISAKISFVASANSTDVSLSGERSIDIALGKYTLKAPLLYYQGRAYGLLQEGQAVEVLPRRELRLEVVFQGLPGADVTFVPRGLLGGDSVSGVLEGPENTRLEATFKGPELFVDVLPGIYKISAPMRPGNRWYIPEQTLEVKPGASSVGFQAVSKAASAAREIATLRGHSSYVYSVAFSPGGQTLASGSGDGTIKLWDVATKQEIANLRGHLYGVYSVAFSPDGKTLASGSGLTIKLWDVATRREIATLQGHSDTVRSVVFSPDGKTLASGSEDYTIKLWDVAGRREVATLRGHSDDVYSVAFSPDGQTLASGGRDGTIKLWDVASSREVATLRGHSREINSVAFSPDGKTLASGSWDNTIKLWDVATQREIATLRGHSDYAISVAFSPDGQTLASGSSDNTIKLWDVATRREIATLRGHLGSLWSVAFSPDGLSLASGGYDNTIKLWQLEYK